MRDANNIAPEEREAWYDAEAAPKLLEIGNACRARGLPGGEPYYYRVIRAAAACWENGGAFNLDRLCTALAREAQGKPHSSVVLKLMGVPERPHGEG